MRDVCRKDTRSSKKRSIHLSAIPLSLRSTSNLDPPMQRISDLMLQPSDGALILSNPQIPKIHFFMENDRNFENQSRYTLSSYFETLNPKTYFALLR